MSFCYRALDALTSQHSISLQFLPHRRRKISVRRSIQSVGSVQLQRCLQFVHFRDPSRFFGQVWKEFAEGFVFEVEFVALPGQVTLVRVRGFDRTQGRALLQHEREQPGQDGGHGPGWVPSVRVVVGTENQFKLLSVVGTRN